MDHARGEPADGRKLLGACNRAIRFHSISNFLSNSDHVADFAGVVGPHRDLADDPVADVALWRWSLLVDALDLTTLKHARKLFRQHVARLSREHVKHVLAQH